jgi:choline dehydrogenase-like flavoprotein
MGLYNSPRSVDAVTGKRSYSGSTYYANSIGKDNFSVLTGAQATKIKFRESKENGNLVAQSVVFVTNGNTYTVSAKKEIILSAGVFQSPQLLELSGIGNATMLTSLGISPLIDLPGVGENLQDHSMLTLVFQVQPGLVTLDQLRINQTFAAAAEAQ